MDLAPLTSLACEDSGIDWPRFGSRSFLYWPIQIMSWRQLAGATLAVNLS